MCFHLVTLLSFFDVGAGCGCGCVGGHRETIHESVGKADQKIKMQVDNIAGVMLPEFKLYKDPEAKAMNTENSALQQKTQKQLPWGMRPQTSSCSCLQERCEPLTQSPDC